MFLQRLKLGDYTIRLRYFSTAALAPLKIGDFGPMPANMAHFAMARGSQKCRRGVGPFAIT